ncbi:hypothetical protein ABZP36_023365, partial [Zizania latifolia]
LSYHTTSFSCNRARLYYTYGHIYRCYKLECNDAFPSWDSGLAQCFSPRQAHGATNNCSSRVENQCGTWPSSEAIEQEIMLPTLHGELLFALH